VILLRFAGRSEAHEFDPGRGVVGDLLAVNGVRPKHQGLFVRTRGRPVAVRAGNDGIVLQHGDVVVPLGGTLRFEATGVFVLRGLRIYEGAKLVHRIRRADLGALLWPWGPTCTAGEPADEDFFGQIQRWSQDREWLKRALQEWS
jgi:hypothetical protein